MRTDVGHCDSDSEEHDLLRQEADWHIEEEKERNPHDFEEQLKIQSQTYGTPPFNLSKSKLKRNNPEARIIIEQCEITIKLWLRRYIDVSHDELHLKSELNDVKQKLLMAETRAKLAEEKLKHYNERDSNDAVEPTAKRQRTK